MQFDQARFAVELDSFLRMNGIYVHSHAVIEAYARRGSLQITNSMAHSLSQVMIGAGPGAHYSFGHNSAIYARGGTAMIAEGDATLEGSNASFVMGPNGVSFRIG